MEGVGQQEPDRGAEQGDRDRIDGEVAAAGQHVRRQVWCGERVEVVAEAG